jgi:hypothetical protein
MLIDIPLLIVGPGPAALVVAKVASGWGLSSLVAGHEPLGGREPRSEHVPVDLDETAIAVLSPHGVLDVLRPYLAVAEPPAIAPVVFEEVLKHHCVVDMNITVYDGMSLVERRARGRGVSGVLTDGRARWDLVADAFVDASTMPGDLNAAIAAGADTARGVLAALT